MKHKLTDQDLRKNKYPLNILEQNVNNLSISTLLRWQTLDADFCKKYILDESYQTTEDYYAVTIEHILRRQPHLRYNELID